MIEDITNTADIYCAECEFARVCNVCIPVSGLSCGKESKERLQKNCQTKKETMKSYFGFYVDLNNSLGGELKKHLSR